MSEGQPQRTGRCLCGAVRYRAEPPWKWVDHCHCASCRRATSSPLTTFFCVPLNRFGWTQGEPKVFMSSPDVRRRFCGACGTPLSYEIDDLDGEIHLYVATLDDDAGMVPGKHAFWSERVAWLTINDDVPKDDR